MAKIEIRGVITSSDYDVDFLFPYIQRGLITPESRVRKLIGQAGKKIDLYINSQGGSVFAGNEMINALQGFVANGGKLSITVGALAASMGSAIVVSLAEFAESIKIYSNTKFMFHGAFGGAIGGSEAMSDYSELLGKINNDIKVKLIRNYNMSPDVVDGWFKEGREGWLNAKEIKQLGMADEIIGEDDEAPESPSGLDGVMTDSGMKVAALALDKYNNKESIMDKLIQKLKNMLGIKEEVTEDEVFDLLDQVEAAQSLLEEVEDDDTNESTDEELSEDESDNSEPEDNSESDGETEEPTEGTETNDADEAEDSEPEESDDVESLEVIDELCNDCIEKEETIDSLNSALNKKQSENDKLKADINKLASKCEKLLGNGLNFQTEKPAPTDWKSCLAECGGDYVMARNKYPEVFAKFINK